MARLSRLTYARADHKLSGIGSGDPKPYVPNRKTAAGAPAR